MTASPPSIVAAALFGAMSPPMVSNEAATGLDAAMADSARRGAARWSALFNRQFGGSFIARSA